VQNTSRSGPSLAGFVLAGGRSLRMGQDKAGLKWNAHQTVLQHMTFLLSTVAEPVRIVGRDDLPDIVPNCGPLGGILTALDASKSPMNLIVAVDLPLLNTEFLVWFGLRAKSSPKEIVVCQIGDDYPLCLAVHHNLKNRLAERIKAGDFALHRWIRESDPEILMESEIQSAGFPSSIFHNVNTPSDWSSIKAQGSMEGG
jgi:molybdenum cofactor guanylyltransferase